MKLTLKTTKDYADLIIDTEQSEIVEGVSHGWKDPKIDEEFIMGLIDVAVDADRFNNGDGADILVLAWDAVSVEAQDKFIEQLESRGRI